MDTNGTFVAISDPLATNGTVAEGINNSGQITGYYTNATGNHGFVYTNGNFVTINDPSATNGTVAYGINDNGQVVGAYTDTTGTHTFMDTLATSTFVPINDTSATG